jgi:hypothetical protein
MRKGQWLTNPPVFLRPPRASNECDVRIAAIRAIGEHLNNYRWLEQSRIDMCNRIERLALQEGEG